MSQQNGADRSGDGGQRDERRPDPSRRSVLHGAAGLAGAGLVATAIGTLGPGVAAAASGASRMHPEAARVTGSADPVIVHVRDLSSGEMDVFAGEAKATLRDPGLAARLAHAIH